MKDLNRENRKLMIDICVRWVKPGSGSGITVFTQRNWRLAVSNISEIFKKTPFVVCGGVAIRAYAPERTTDDLDILICTADAPTAYQELENAGAVYLQELSIPGSEWQLPDGTILDVLESNSGWARDAIKNPNRNNPLNLPIIPLPQLILMKLHASRSVDIHDVSRIVAQADETTLNIARKLVKTHLPTATDDLESLLYLGRLELEQPKKVNSSYKYAKIPANLVN